MDPHSSARCSRVSSIQSQMPQACPAGLPALSHIHDHPVFGINILSNQILKHDKSFHEEVLKRTKEWLEENWATCHKPSPACGQEENYTRIRCPQSLTDSLAF